MKKLIRNAFLTATIMIISVAFYSCKEKETTLEETDIDAVETVEPVESLPADTTTMPADSLTVTAPAP